MANNQETPIWAKEKIETTLQSSAIKDIMKFLDWKDMSDTEYKIEYEKISKSLLAIEGELKPLAVYLNSQKWDFSPLEWKAIQDTLSAFSNLKRSMKEGILTPEEFSEKLNKDKPINLWKIDPISSLTDVTLNSEQLSNLKPTKLLAKTADGVCYYMVSYDWKSTILRYNPNDMWDEVALFINTVLNDQMSKDDLKRIIMNGEKQQWFKDVEMNWTWDSRTVALAALSWGTAGWATWAWFWAAAWLWVLSIPGSFIWWSIWAIWWATIAGISAAWDQDYTSEDYNNDFWTDIQSLNQSSKNKINYKR